MHFWECAKTRYCDLSLVIYKRQLEGYGVSLMVTLNPDHQEHFVSDQPIQYDPFDWVPYD